MCYCPVIEQLCAHSVVKGGKPVWCGLAAMDMDKVKQCPILKRIAEIREEGNL